MSLVPYVSCTRKSGIGRLPLHIWSEEIFRPHLFVSEMKIISLTCQFFRSLAQPLLFRSIKLPTNTNPGDMLESIRFFSTPRIARVVRLCSIAHTKDRQVIDAFFEVLPLLPNLQSLDLWNISLTFPNIMLHLDGRCLDFAYIVNSPVDNWQTEPPVSVPSQTLHINDCHACHVGPIDVDSDESQVAMWKSFVDPMVLREAKVLNRLTATFLSEITPLGPFTKLRCLTFRLSRPNLPYLAFLEQCPLLMHLAIVWEPGCPQGIIALVPSQTAVPLLHGLEAPDIDTINGFMRGRAVRDLTIPGTIPSTRWAEVKHILEEIQYPETVETIHLGIDRLSCSTLVVLSERFPNLQEITIRADGFKSNFSANVSESKDTNGLCHLTLCPSGLVLFPR